MSKQHYKKVKIPECEDNSLPVFLIESYSPVERVTFGLIGMGMMIGLGFLILIIPTRSIRFLCAVVYLFSTTHNITNVMNTYPIKSKFGTKPAITYFFVCLLVGVTGLLFLPTPSVLRRAFQVVIIIQAINELMCNFAPEIAHMFNPKLRVKTPQEKKDYFKKRAAKMRASQ